jgi:hypothetical protein
VISKNLVSQHRLLFLALHGRTRRVLHLEPIR